MDLDKRIKYSLFTAFIFFVITKISVVIEGEFGENIEKEIKNSMTSRDTSKMLILIICFSFPTWSTYTFKKNILLQMLFYKLLF